MNKRNCEKEQENIIIEMGCFACFDGGSKQERREEERLASEEARANAAAAAQKRFQSFSFCPAIFKRFCFGSFMGLGES